LLPRNSGASITEPGLRDRKKARQRSQLLDVAAELFRLNGYDRTRMEDIAAKAEVSTKTVYNYFATKREVLFDFLNRDRAEMTAAYQAVLESPPADPVDALVALMEADLGPVTTVEEKTLWRELMLAALRAHDRVDDDFERNRRMFSAYIERLLAHFQEAGRLSAALDLSLAAEILHTVHSDNFRKFCALDDFSRQELFDLARRQMILLLDRWLI
jgi:AcrR family transcriptional regulator